MAKLWTVGTIAETAGVPLHRVEYFVKSRGIKASARAGALRVFTDADARSIISALKEPSRAEKRAGV